MPRDDRKPDPFREDLSTVGAERAHDGARTGLSLRIVHDTVVTTRALPPRGDLVVGRSRDVDVPVPHGSISRRHAVLHLGPPMEIEDLGSANGTVVGGRVIRAHERAPLLPGTVVEMGNVMIVVQAALQPEPPSEPRAPAPAPAPAPPPAGAAMQQLHRLVERIAAGNLSVLLFGETGVGKEVMAETIHRLSPRAGKPFLKLNCAAFSEALLASELFGHEKGAFSGADQPKPGLLESAHGGTVLLDEVGELTPSIQAKLLRVLEERAVLRVGGLRPRPIDVRFVAATNRDLEQEVARGAFRQDLLFRLDGFSIVIPPLRERLDELPGLVRAFVAEASTQLGRRRPPEIAPGVLSLLASYAWPGNVRELRNVVERAVLLCGAAGHVIQAEHLPLEKLRGAPSMAPPAAAPSVPAPAPAPANDEEALRDRLQQVERDRVLAALAQCAGNQTQAAKLLGVSRNTLAARIAAFGLPRPRKRP